MRVLLVALESFSQECMLRPPTSRHNLSSLIFFYSEARLVDPKTNKDIPVGEEGELWVRGPVVMMYGLASFSEIFRYVDC